MHAVQCNCHTVHWDPGNNICFLFLSFPFLSFLYCPVLSFAFNAFDPSLLPSVLSFWLCLLPCSALFCAALPRAPTLRFHCIALHGMCSHAVFPSAFSFVSFLLAVDLTCKSFLCCAPVLVEFARCILCCDNPRVLIGSCGDSPVQFSSAQLL